MANVEIFQNEAFGQVRVIIRNNEPWFVASDVAAALGYGDPQGAVSRHCKYVELFKSVDSTDLGGGPRGLNIIPEADVYALIFRSNLPKAEAFRSWVYEEVLPTIRKTGSYGTPATPAAPIESVMDAANKVLTRAGLEPNQVAIGMSNAYRKVTGVDVLQASEMALPSPVQKQALTPTEIGKEIGNIGPKQINKLLLDRGYQVKRVNGGYDPTPVGEPHALLLDTAKRHSDGTPVKQLKWYTTILPIIRDWLTPEPDTDEEE